MLLFYVFCIYVYAEVINLRYICVFCNHWHADGKVCAFSMRWNVFTFICVWLFIFRYVYCEKVSESIFYIDTLQYAGFTCECEHIPRGWTSGVDMSVGKIENKNGPSTLPCGTPATLTLKRMSFLSTINQFCQQS